jgi:uncharacterized hydrophobic protein (TIGR00341 family)
MKKLEVTVTNDEASKVEKLLEETELVYLSSAVEIEGEKCCFYSIVLPDNLADKAVADISKVIDLRLRENTIGVICVEGAVSTYLDRLREKAAKKPTPPSPLERLVESTERYTRLSKDVLTMALFATMIALAGLFLDNVAIVIGAMLLSPLLGPINAFAVNANLGRIKKLARSQGAVLLLLAAIIFLATALTFVVSQFVGLSENTTQIIIRNHATLTDILIALILGLAAGLALFVGFPEILVGVAIAVAIVPPAAVSGIGLALFNIDLFLGALILTFIYLFGLQLGSTLMLRIRGVLPRRYYQQTEARRHSAYSILILAVLLAILSLIVILSQLA